MDMFEYIATDNPQACSDLCTKYGFQAKAANTSDLGDCMSQLVEQAGAPALHDLVALHPDKDLILEQYGPGAAGTDWSGGSTGGCGCASCRAAGAGGNQVGPVAQQYLQAAAQQGNSFIHTHMAGLFIIGGLLVVTLAMISTKP